MIIQIILNVSWTLMSKNYDIIMITFHNFTFRLFLALITVLWLQYTKLNYYDVQR